MHLFGPRPMLLWHPFNLPSACSASFMVAVLPTSWLQCDSASEGVPPCIWQHLAEPASTIMIQLMVAFSSFHAEGC